MNIPRLLYQLQETDLAIEAAQAGIAAVKADLAADPLAAERRAIAGLKAKAETLRHELRETSAEADDFSARIKHHEEQLYSGRVSNPKELTALQKDIDLLKGHRAPHEEKALELMEAIETTENDIDTAEITLQRHKETLETNRQKLEKQLKKLGDELAGLESSRAALMAEIPPPAAIEYEWIKKQRGRAVAKVEQSICRGCGIAVTTAWMHRARSGEPVHCPSCNRILYLE